MLILLILLQMLFFSLICSFEQNAHFATKKSKTNDLMKKIKKNLIIMKE